MKRENILRGKKVGLSAVKEADVATVSEWYQDAAFLRLYDSKPTYPQTEKQIAERLREGQKNRDTYLFAIRLLDSGRIIGLLELDGIAWTHGSTFVSVGIGEEADRGQGYGREAMRLGLRFAFDELNLHPYCLKIKCYRKRGRCLINDVTLAVATIAVDCHRFAASIQQD